MSKFVWAVYPPVVSSSGELTDTNDVSKFFPWIP